MTGSSSELGAGAPMYADANSLFVDELFEDSLCKYNEAVEAEPQQPLYMLKRAAVYLKLKSYEAALQDTNRCIELIPSNVQAHLRRGISLFYLKEFESARESFETAMKLGGRDCDIWINKCNIEISDLPPGSKQTCVEECKLQTEDKSSVPPPTSTLTMAQKIKDSFYQNTNFVIFTIFAKNLTANDVSIVFHDKRVDVDATMSDSSVFSRHVSLTHAIDPNNSTFIINKFKIVITLKKIEHIDWCSYEGSDDSSTITSVLRPNDRSEVTSNYPTSSIKKHDWSTIEKNIIKEEEKEEPQGDAALNKLFQQIYGNADADTQRAMKKSYQTSGGTVLSTNWSEVKDKAYEKEIEAPAGMQVHKWNE